MGSKSSHLKYVASEESQVEISESEKISETGKQEQPFYIQNYSNKFVCPQNHNNCYDSRCWW